MTAVQPRVDTPPSPPVRARAPERGSRLLHLLRTTDPKDLGVMYLVTTFVFFLIGGAMALLIRGELQAA